MLTDLQSEIHMMIHHIIQFGEFQAEAEAKDPHAVASIVLENLEYCAKCEDIKMPPQVREACMWISKYIQVTDYERFPETYKEYALCNIVEYILCLFERYHKDITAFPTCELHELLGSIFTIEQINEIKHKLLNPQDMDIENFKLLNTISKDINSDELLLHFIYRILLFKSDISPVSSNHEPAVDMELEEIFDFMWETNFFRKPEDDNSTFFSDCNVVLNEIERRRNSRLSYEKEMLQKRLFNINDLKRELII